MSSEDITTLAVRRETRERLREAQDGDTVDETINRLAKFGTALREFTSKNGEE